MSALAWTGLAVLLVALACGLLLWLDALVCLVDRTPRPWCPRMINIRIKRVNVRLFWRGFDCPQRPYFSRKYTIASFGAGPFGVMLMEIWTAAEICAFNARHGANLSRPLPPRAPSDWERRLMRGERT